MSLNWTIEQLKSWIDATFPDNVARSITEADLRDVLNKTVDWVFETNSSAFIADAMANIEDLNNQANQRKAEILIALAETVTARNETVQERILAQQAVANAVLGQNPLGEYNPQTNTPTLSETPTIGIAVGSFYDITVEGQIPFSGSNFDEDDMFSIGGRLIKKDNANWYYQPPSNLALSKVLLLEAALPEKLPSSAVASNQVKSKNLFDPANVVNNSYVNTSNGIIQGATGWKRTGPIPCLPSTNYTIQGLISRSSKAVRFESAAGAYISHVSLTGSGTVATFSTPANATFMYVTLQNGSETVNLNVIQIEEGSLATEFEPYYEPIDVLESIAGATLPFKTINGKRGDAAGNIVINAQTLGVLSLIAEKLSTSAIVKSQTKSKNLFAAANIVDNSYVVTSNGSLGTAAGWKRTGPIPCLPSTNYTIQGLISKSSKAVRFESAAGAYISHVSLTGSGTVATFSTPANATFMYVTLQNGSETVNLNVIQIEEGSLATEFEPYYEPIDVLESIAGATLPFKTINGKRGDAAGNIVINAQSLGIDTNGQTGKITLANGDKILFPGCSFVESAYAIKGKSYVAKISQWTDWIIANAGQSGRRMIDIADRIRKNVASYGLTPSAFKPTYVILANNGNETFPESGENLDLYLEQFRIAAEAVHAIGAKPIIGTDFNINSNKYVEAQLKEFADRNQFPYMGVGAVGEKVLSKSYAGFWGGGHPGTRTNAFIWKEWLYFLSQLPRPRKSIKIFRPRSSGAGTSDLNYDTIEQRHQRWIELNPGERCLHPSDGSQDFYDRLNEGTTVDPEDENNITVNYTITTQNNEYSPLFSGLSVAFTDYALIELIVDKLGVSSFKIFLKGDAGLSFRVKNNNDPAAYESVLRDTELVFQVSQAVYNAFTDPVGTKFTSSGVSSGAVQFAFTGKLKSYAMGTGWFLCFSADSAVPQSNRVTATTAITRVSNSSTVATLNQKKPYRYGYSYFAGINKPKGSWKELTTEVVYQAGLYTITLPANSLQYFEFDKLKLLVAKSGAFSITGIEAEYTGGTEKPSFTREIEQKPAGTELIITRGFDENWTAVWTANGNVLVSLPVGARDYPPFLATIHHVELGFDSEGFSRKISRTITVPGAATDSRGFRKAIVRVVARMFPKIYNPSKTGEHFSSTPVITQASDDLGMLCAGLRKTGSILPGTVMRQTADIGWQELTFETSLPPGETELILDLWRDCELYNQNPQIPLQVYDVSFQVV